MTCSETVRLVTDDDIRLVGVHHTGPDRHLAIVVAHGFTGSVRRPGVDRIMRHLTRYAGVLGVDFRGHGDSGGVCSGGDVEVRDLVAAVAAVRQRGYRRIATVGFSMGGSIALRHAAGDPGLDAVVSISAPARWYERGTAPMRRVHWLNETRLGRRVARTAMQTRLAGPWAEPPEAPVEVVGRIAPRPLLIVHGDRDSYFPLEHPRALAAAAGTNARLWLVAGMGHAETAVSPDLASAVGRWIRAAVLPSEAVPV